MYRRAARMSRTVFITSISMKGVLDRVSVVVRLCVSALFNDGSATRAAYTQQKTPKYNEPIWIENQEIWEKLQLRNKK
jgi:hypothetical protein